MKYPFLCLYNIALVGGNTHFCHAMPGFEKNGFIFTKKYSDFSENQ